jgi:hypothetical protein
VSYDPGPDLYGQPYGQQPPVVPGSSPPGYGPPVPGQPYAPLPPKKPWGGGKVTLVVLGAIVGFCLVGAVALAILNDVLPSHRAAAPGSRVVATSGTQGTDAPADTPEATATPKAADFKLTPKITRKHCFGSAGCNVDYEINLEYSGPSLDDSDTWVLTYEATGDESGPVTGQLEVTGTKYSGETQTVSTPSTSTKIKIKVTDVEKQ